MKKLIILLFVFLSFMFGYIFGEVVTPKSVYADEKPIVLPGILWDYSGSGPVICECPNENYDCYCIFGSGGGM